MAPAKRGLVDRVKRAVARASTRGAMTLVEGTASAVRTVDRLQEKLASRRKQGGADTAPAVSATQAPEAKRAIPRPTEARVTGTRATPRTAGRKAMPGTEAAAKRVKAPRGQAKAPAAKKPRQGGFKVKRGQKHQHSGR